MQQKTSDSNYRDYLKKLSDGELIKEIKSFIENNSSAPNTKEINNTLNLFEATLDEAKKILKRNALISQFLIFINNARNAKIVFNIEAVDKFLYNVLNDLEKEGVLVKYPFFRQFIEPVFLGVISIYEAIETSKRANFFRYTLDLLTESFKNPSNIRVHFLPLELAEFISTMSANFELQESDLLSFINAYEMLNQVYSLLDIQKALKSAGVARGEEGDVQKLTLSISVLIREVFEKLAMKYDDAEHKFYDSLDHSLQKKDWLKLLPSEEKTPEEMDPDHLEGVAITEHLIVLLQNTNQFGSIIKDERSTDVSKQKAEKDFESNWQEISAIIYDFEKARKIIWFDNPRGINLIYEFGNQSHNQIDFIALQEFLMVLQVVIAISRSDYDLLEEVQNAIMHFDVSEGPIFQRFFVTDISTFSLIQPLNENAAARLQNLFFQTFDCAKFEEISYIIDSFLYEPYLLRLLENLNKRNLRQAFDDLILKSKFVLENQGDLQRFSWSICSNVAVRFYDSGAVVRDFEDMFWNDPEIFSIIFSEDFRQLSYIAREICSAFTLADLKKLKNDDLKSIISLENENILKAYYKSKSKSLDDIIEYGFEAIRSTVEIMRYLKYDLRIILDSIKDAKVIELRFLSSLICRVINELRLCQDYEGDNDLQKLRRFYRVNENKLRLLLVIEEVYKEDKSFNRLFLERNLRFLLSRECTYDFITILAERGNIHLFNLATILSSEFLYNLLNQDRERLEILKRKDFYDLVKAIELSSQSKKEVRIQQRKKFVNEVFLEGRCIRDLHQIVNYLSWLVKNFKDADLQKQIKAINENHTSYLVLLDLMNNEARGLNASFPIVIKFVIHLKKELQYSREDTLEAWKLIEWINQNFQDFDLGLFTKKLGNSPESLNGIRKAQFIMFDNKLKFALLMQLIKLETFESICELAKVFHEASGRKMSIRSLLVMDLCDGRIIGVKETAFAKELRGFLITVERLNLSNELNAYFSVFEADVSCDDAIKLLMPHSDEILMKLLNENILRISRAERYESVYSACISKRSKELSDFLISKKCTILLDLDYGYKRIASFFQANKSFIDNISDEDFEKVMKGVKEVMLAIKFLRSGKRVKIGKYETAILKAANDDSKIVEQSTVMCRISQQLSEFMLSSEDLNTCVLIPNEIKAIMLENLKLDSNFIGRNERRNELAI